MKRRAVGISLVAFGLTGVIASVGVWWSAFRYLRSFDKSAGLTAVACTTHCGGVDGIFLVAAIGSGIAAVLGLVIALSGPVRRHTRQSAPADGIHF
jgi:hypothetical protein